MTNNQKLKPCPFCGCDMTEFPEFMAIPPVHTEEYLLAKFEHKKIIGSDAGYAVECCKCGAVGRRGMSRKEAAENWNMRADDGSYVDKLAWNRRTDNG